MFQDAFAHTTAKLWVDRLSDADRSRRSARDERYFLRRGYPGKTLSRQRGFDGSGGDRPGIWLPTRYQYDYAGRKFLFTFDQHQIIEVSRYRRIGPPNEALQTVQNELSSGKTFSEDP